MRDSLQVLLDHIIIAMTVIELAHAGARGFASRHPGALCDMQGNVNPE